jgi:hypothetical protein
VTPLGWLATIVLSVQLPIPLFWFVVYPQINDWRNHRSAGYATALLAAWVPVALGEVVAPRHSCADSSSALCRVSSRNVGACFLAGTPLMWIVAGILTVLTLVATSIEEHELGARFGAAYEDYSRQVTPFAPVDAKPREG